MPNRLSLMRWIRIASAILALAFGALHLASGLAGPQAIRFGVTPEHYYQIVAAPSQNFWLWGISGLAMAAFLFAIPKIFEGQK